MPSTKDIRKKISSTKNTQQITKAMKMVSAAKLRRAQNAITGARPYAERLQSLMLRLAKDSPIEHPLLKTVENPKKVLLVVLTSDRGLCGAFNSNVIKTADRFFAANKSKYEAIDFLFLGRKAADYFKKRNVYTVDVMTNLATEVSFDMAGQLAEKLTDHFIDGDYDEVRLFYNEFRSAISQRAVSTVLLPLSTEAEEQTEARAEHPYYRFEPDAREIMLELLPKYFAVQVFRAMLESVASEHGARMSAMDSATRTAREQKKKLTLTYNKLRQAAITRELVEIVSGAEALN